MPFNAFKTLSEAAAKSGLRALTGPALPELEPNEPDEALVAQLAWARARRKSASGEAYMREFYIAPILQTSLRPFDYLNIWSSDYALCYDELYSGYPDYLITGMPVPFAPEDPEQKPFLAIAEAKRENFTEGWGQCLAELYACQQLNGDPNLVVWGIVTNGETWQFGKLEGGVFTRHSSSLDLDPLGKLLAVLHYIFKQCDDAARKAAGAI